MSAISIRSVRKDFKGHQALKSIELEVLDRECCVLLGPSGCGKTTLMRIIAGLEEATEGEVWIGERRVDALPPRQRRIAMVFQNYAVFPHMTIGENIGAAYIFICISKVVIAIAHLVRSFQHLKSPAKTISALLQFKQADPPSQPGRLVLNTRKEGVHLCTEVHLVAHCAGAWHGGLAGSCLARGPP